MIATVTAITLEGKKIGTKETGNLIRVDKGSLWKSMMDLGGFGAPFLHQMQIVN